MSLRNNTLWNIGGNAIPLLVGALTIPFLIPRLGLERFGILTLLWTVIGYFSLFDFGIGRALTQQLASLRGSGNLQEIPQTVRAGMEFTGLTGLLGCGVLMMIAYPLCYFGLGITANLQDEVFWSFMIAAIGIPFATMSNGLRGVLEGYEKFQASNWARMLLGLSIFLFPALAVMFHGNSLVTVTAWLVVARVLSFVLFLVLVLRLPSRRFWLAQILQGTRRKLFGFGAWMALSNLVSPLLVSADRFVISSLLGASVVAFYTLPFEFLVRLLILPAALGSTLLPSLARDRVAYADRARDTFRKSTRMLAMAMAFFCICAALLAYPLMDRFISADFASRAWVPAVILSIGVWVNGIAYLPYTALHASGQAKSTAILHCLEFVFYIPILLLLVHWLGINGAALAWTLRTTVDAFALFWLHHINENGHHRESSAKP